MTAQLNAVSEKVPEGHIGWVEEIAGANVQRPPWKRLGPASWRRYGWFLPRTASWHG
jgi:hypothetical protein